MEELERRVTALKGKVDKLIEDIGVMNGLASANGNLIKYVVLPLIVIVGGLVGIKIVG